MTNVAEKVGEVTGKQAAGTAAAGGAEKNARPAAPPEKRRALGRGLESLLPGGPRVVAGTAVSPAYGTRAATSPVAGSAKSDSATAPAAASASTSISVSSPAALGSSLDSAAPETAANVSVKPIGAVESATAQAAQVSATERREPGAPSSVTPSAQDAGLGAETPAASPMAGLERPVVRNEAIGTAPAAVATSASSIFTSSRPIPVNAAGGENAGEAARATGGAVGDLQGAAAKSDPEGVEVVELRLDKIDPNPYQTRHFTEEDEVELVELGQSIKAQGLIQPITVREGKNGRYILIAGDRRTRASRLAELETIPAIIWDVSEQQAAEMTVIENLMREDLNCMDQTRAFVLLSSKFRMTQAEIADRMGMSRESVSNYMRLARLPQEVQDYLIKNELEYSHARLLLKIDNDEVLLRVARKVAKEHIPVWELEDMMLSSNPTLLKPPDEKKQSRGARWVDPNVKAAQRDLERVLGMRVRIRDRNNKGRIVIEYSTLEDFDRVVGALKGK